MQAHEVPCKSHAPPPHAGPMQPHACARTIEHKHGAAPLLARAAAAQPLKLGRRHLARRGRAGVQDDAQAGQQHQALQRAANHGHAVAVAGGRARAGAAAWRHAAVAGAAWCAADRGLGAAAHSHVHSALARRRAAPRGAADDWAAAWARPGSRSRISTGYTCHMGRSRRGGGAGKLRSFGDEKSCMKWPRVRERSRPGCHDRREYSAAAYLEAYLELVWHTAQTTAQAGGTQNPLNRPVSACKGSSKPNAQLNGE